MQRWMRVAAIMMGLVGSVASANVCEDFAAYTVGDYFPGVQANWTAASGDWYISEYYGDHILAINSADDVILKCAAEEFDSAAGYTVMMRMMYKWPYGGFSGLVYDMSADGSAFRRFFPQEVIGYVPDVWTFYRLLRSAGHVSVWVSSYPITTENPGSLAVDQDLDPLPGGGNCVGLYGVHTVYFDDVGIFHGDYLPGSVTVTGTVIAEGYVGDNATVAATIRFQPVGGGADITRTVVLNDNGTFALDDIPQGTYNIAVKGACWLETVLNSRTVSHGAPDLGPIELRGGNSNGDGQVSFEDFSILQNNYGRSGPNTISLSAAAPHAVDGILSVGEWANLYTDPSNDKPGDVELIRWGAEVRNGTLYAAFELDPNGPTVAEYNDFEGGKNIWLSLWLDVDPAANPMTGVPVGDSQFSPRAQDIYVELGTDQGTLEGSHGWHSLNLWGHSDNFSYSVPVAGGFAYSDHVVEFSCPVSDILAELPNTDGAAPAEVWTVGARAAGHGFDGSYDGDITELKPLTTSGVYGQVVIPGYLANVGVKFEFIPTGAGTAAVRLMWLNADGTFRLDDISAGTYTVRVTSPGTLGAVLTNVSISGDPASLGTIELTGADFSGDGRVGFEDFSILQNNYGEAETSGTANPLRAAAVAGCGGLGIALLSFLGLAFLVLRPWNG